MNQIKVTIYNKIIANFGSLGNFSTSSGAGIAHRTLYNFLNLQDNASINFSSLISIMDNLNLKFTSNNGELNKLLDKFGNISLGLNLKNIRASVTRNSLANMAKTTAVQINRIESALGDFRFKTLYSLYEALDTLIFITPKI